MTVSRLHVQSQRETGVFSNFMRLIRAPAFMLSFVYLIVFTISAVTMLNYLDAQVQRVFNQYFIASIDAEQSDLQNLYNLGGEGALSSSITDRMRTHLDAYYLYKKSDGSNIGNIPNWPEGGAKVSESESDLLFTFSDVTGVKQEYIGRVSQFNNGEQLLIGRDIDRLTQLKMIIRKTSQWAIFLAEILGITGGFFIASRILSRVDVMSEDTLAIMNGDLSGRLKVTGSGDEIDRLAESINEMLSQIEELMNGLKQVSDNIAHDLKTPLTRLRNRAFDALSSAKNEDDLRDSLDYIIEESDNLIKVFNSLLIIARMEAGHASENLVYYDASSVVTDIAELYEALAEDEGIVLEADIEPNLGVYGNRELLFQALSNLFDNALKYGQVEPDSGILPVIRISASHQANFAIIDVADRGKGIPDADKEKVLLRFTRLEVSRTQPGFGLGLSLVSAVANLHGGYVKLENNHPGLIVRLVIPLKNKKVVGVSEDF